MAHPDLQIRTAGALGGEIAGIDLTQDVDDGAIAAIRRAWLATADQRLPWLPLRHA